MGAELRSVPIEKITVGARLRPADPDYVAVLKRSFEQDGMKAPVLIRPVKRRLILVAGFHRLTAAKELGWTEISALVEEMTDGQALLAEIEENLSRAELTALDRALFIDRRHQLLEGMGLINSHGGDRRSDGNSGENQTAKLAVRKSTETKLGLSERSIRRARELARKLDPVAIEIIRHSDVSDNATKLKVIAGLPRSAQIKAATRFTSGEKVTPPKPNDNRPKDLARLLKAWKGAGTESRQAFLEEIGARLDG